MLRHKPKFKYCGLTVVLSNPSRADTTQLLSAKGGKMFSEFLGPEHNEMQCDVRVKEDKSPLLEGTKCILLLGEPAANDWLPETKDNNFGSIRGYIYKHQNIPTICTYFPQDAYDRQDFERKYNDKIRAGLPEEHGQDKEGSRGLPESSIESKSRGGKTDRANFKFWLRKDIDRCKHILVRGDDYYARSFEPSYTIYPNSLMAIESLTGHKDEHFYIDIETDADLNVLCFAFAYSSRPENIFVIPIIDHNYMPAYGDSTFNIMVALQDALTNNITVAHNGAAFDFLVLAMKYKLGIGKRSYDTMIAHHRCFPEVEKSLGHCMSMWVPSESYHKDEANFTYRTSDQAHQLYAYCGKDVYGMILLHRAIEAYAQTKPGLKDSIAQAMSSIRPYLITTLLGFKYSEETREAIVKENDALMEQYLRLIEILVGVDNLKQIQGKSKSAMPSSNKQCCKYFHEMLEYPIVHRSQKTNKPSLAKEQMYKLKLKYSNPVIDIIIAYRETQHETGMLSFTPWKQ